MGDGAGKAGLFLVNDGNGEAWRGRLLLPSHLSMPMQVSAAEQGERADDRG